MGEVKTAGRGWEAPLGLPSAVAIVTVGRDAIVVAVAGRCRREVGDRSRDILVWIFSLRRKQLAVEPYALIPFLVPRQPSNSK